MQQNTPVKTGRRKIHQRTRNGCITCKIRKVKCDETRPHCHRCHSTGRKCDGYDDRHRTSSPPDFSIFRPSIIPGLDTRSSTILDHFYRSLETDFLLPFGYLFWTRLVTNLIVQEPAVRHATISLVGLYEQRKSPDTHRLYDTRVLIQHYNSAMKEIRSLVSLRTTQLGTVLVACILFACIELMRRDFPAAMIHIKYGIDMINASEDGSIIAIFLRQLSLLPIFTNQPLRSLPLIAHREACEMPDDLSSFTVVQVCINGLQYRAFRLARAKEEYREAQLQAGHDTWFREEQNQLMLEVDSLQRKFVDFKRKIPDDRKLELTSCLLEVQLLLLKVWVYSRNVFTDHDSSAKEFEGIIECARKSLVLSSSLGLSFEIGLAPHLHYAFVNCRSLGVHIRVLSLIQSICLNNQDILWNAEGIFRLCATLLETEHGIKVDGLDTNILYAVHRSRMYGRESTAYPDLKGWQGENQLEADSPGVSILRSGTAGYAPVDSGCRTRVLEQGETETVSQDSSARGSPAVKVDVPISMRLQEKRLLG